MLKPSLSPAVATLLNECDAPTHCCTADAKAMLLPIEDVIAAARMQLATERALLRRAELDAELNPEILNKLQLIRQQQKVLAAAIEAAAEPLQRLTDAMHRRDRVMSEARETLELRDAAAVVKVDGA